MSTTAPADTTDNNTADNNPCTGTTDDNIQTNRRKRPDTGGSGDAKPGNHGITNLRNFLVSRRVELGSWVARILVVYFTTMTIFPFFGSGYVSYRRALLANAATSALRLHQRLPRPIAFSKEFIGRLLLEDSCHHLFYSLTFLYFGPVTLTLIPIVLFASLNVASFSLQMLEAAKGPSCKFSSGLGSLLFSWTLQTNWILKMAACAEILLMGLLVLNCFRGTGSIITPLVYYRFLSLRYASRRNPNTRNVFYEMRMACEKFMTSGTCPGIVTRILRFGITLICKLAPAVNIH